MTDQLLQGLKSNLLIPKDVTDLDETLKIYLMAGKEYVDGIIDQKAPEDDKLYQLCILFLSSYLWLQKDNGKLKNIPVTLDTILDRLKFKYQI